MPIVTGTAAVNGVEIAYEIRGDEASPVILLIMGLGLPMTAWPGRLIDKLVDSGYRVLLFDNRDMGHSTILRHYGVPNIAWQAIRHLLRLPVRTAYTLRDMAADATGLLDWFGIERAHVIGASMGGMIAQILAIEVPDRVASLTSVMSSTGSRKLPGPTSAVRRFVVRGPRDQSEEAMLKYHREFWPLIGSPGFKRTDEEFDAFLERIFARGMPREGGLRQLCAVAAAEDRTAALGRLEMPVLVVHGADDPLVPVAAGQATAAAVPGAELSIIDGMGHDLPDALIPRLVGLIEGNLRKTRSTDPIELREC